MPDQTIDDHLPLSPVVFNILLALADDDKHGYAIMQDVEEMTDGRMKMGPGTLYGAIKRMLKRGLIDEVDERPDPEIDDRRRRYYRLAPFGARVLQAEVARMQHLLNVAQRKRVTGDLP